MNDGTRSLERILVLQHHHRPSSRVLANAAELARRTGAELTYADVSADGDAQSDLYRAERLAGLRSLLAPHVGGVEARYGLMSGDPASVAREAAAEHDLIFLEHRSTESEAAHRELVELLRSSQVPVWLDQGAAQAPKRILAAVDVLTSEPAKESLNLPIARSALRLAAALDARLEVLAVETPPTSSARLVERLAGPLAGTEGDSRTVEADLEALVVRARRSAGVGPVETGLRAARGNPDAVIAEIVRSGGVDLLVAGHVGRSGLGAWLVGDTAERLARELRCSLLAVRPEPVRSERAA